MKTSITGRTAKALAAAAIALPILAGTTLSFAQGAPAPAVPAATTTAPAAPAADAPETLEIGALRDMNRIAIKGRVAEVFGDTFIVEDASGRALVETGPGRKGGAKVAVGDTVTVEGRFARGTFQGMALLREDGSREALRDPRGPGRDGPEDGGRRADRDGPDGREGRDGPRGPGHHGKKHDGPRAERDDDKGGVFGWFSGGVDEATATKTVTDAGYKDVTLVDTGPRHAEFRAKDAAGAEWSVKVNDDGEIAEREPYKAAMTETDARAAIEKLGYTYEGDFEARREHVEVEAKDRAGKTVLVELNADGSLRKERFDN